MSESTDATVPTATSTEGTSEEQKQPSKKALKKLEKERQKAEAKAKRQQQQQQQQQQRAATTDAEDVSKDFYGVLPIIRSVSRPGRTYTDVSALTAESVNTDVLLRGRIHNVRPQGSNLMFIVLRQRTATVQLVAVKSATVSRQMLKFLSQVTAESIVDIEGKVVAPDQPIYNTTQQTVEIQLRTLFVVSAAQTPLPILIEDAERPKPLLDEQKANIKRITEEMKDLQSLIDSETDSAAREVLVSKLKEKGEEKSRAQVYVRLSQKEILDNRVLALRTTTNQAIFTIQSGVCTLFREFLLQRNFIEIHTPKLISAASEGGADVFKVGYFDRPAYLAQSPQLYKQMAVCSDLDRVFEIAPVFRAEDSNTHRHMTEFMGLDMEMAFREHYHEVLDVLDELFIAIFDGLKTRFGRELDVIRRQFPFEDLVYHRPSLRLKYTELIDLLRADGQPDKSYTEDISTTEERRLGVLVKEKYNSDFYIVDKFPLSVRPFYTMPDPEDERFSNSYDIFLRGEEIMSGAQRIHDSALLEERARAKNVDVQSIQAYIDAFKFGAPPHAGGGIGLERIVMLYLNIGNIRRTSMFPRDPKRLTP